MGMQVVCDYQVPVDEAVSLQVLHPLTHILTHAQQHISTKMALSLPEEIQKAAPFHELGHDVNGSLLGAYTIKLYQLRVCQFPGREVMQTHSYCRERNCPGYEQVEGPVFNTKRGTEKKKCRNLHHHFSFFYKVFLTHGAFPNSFDGYFVLSSPLAQPHHSKQSTPQLPHKGQL